MTKTLPRSAAGLGVSICPYCPREVSLPVPWTPAELEIEAWWDAADVNSLTVSGGFVTMWKDKTENNWDAVQAVANNQPRYGVFQINGIDVLTFDGSNDILHFVKSRDSVNPADMIAFRNRAVYGVCQINQIKNNTLVGSTLFYQIRTDFSTSFMHVIASPSLWPQPISTLAVTINTPHILGYEGTDFLATSLDGTLYRHPGGYLRVATAPVGHIGAAWTGTQTADRFNGHIAEIIFCDAPSDADRAKIQGYLAWKWGLVGVLPADHPYKTRAPMTGPLG